MRVKDGVAYPSYGCSANGSKGDAICPNRSTISEKKADAAVVQGLLDYVESGDFASWVEEALVAEEAAAR